MQVHARSLCMIMRCSSEVIKNLWEAMSVVCTAYNILEPFFSCVFSFLKFKRGMPTSSSMTTPHRVYILRIYSAVFLVLAIKSLKMIQMVDFFCFAVVKRLCAELISK